MLVAVIFMLAILILSLSIALPRVRASIQRDREVETMHRGKQYIRAVQLYYKKFNAYPPNVDALVKTNDIRFLRKKYIDPTTGKEEWKPILFGQNKTPQAMGFFGQPLAAANGAGIGPGGGNTRASTAQAAAWQSERPPRVVACSATIPPAPPIRGNDSRQYRRQRQPCSGNGNDWNCSRRTRNLHRVGIRFIQQSHRHRPDLRRRRHHRIFPAKPKQSILVYKKKNHYNEWEFLYSPMMDQQTMGGGNTGAIGQPASSTTLRSPLAAPPGPSTPTMLRTTTHTPRPAAITT